MNCTFVVRLVGCAVCSAALLLTAGCREEASTDASPMPVPVQTCRVKQITMHPVLDLVGTIVAIPERSASVSPQTGGWIKELAVTEGQSVAAEQTLIKLDRRLAEVKRDKASAVLAEKRAALALLQKGYLPQEIEMARAAMAEAQANADTLKQQVTAARQLYEKQEMSEVQFGKLRAAAAAAAAVCQSAAAQVDLVEAGTRPEEIAKGEALVDAAEADLASAQLAFEFCTIRSPIAGRVTQLFARAGMFAERAIVLVTVTDLSSLFAKVRIPSDHQADVARDAVARVTIAALPSQSFQGKIARLSGQADRTTGNVDAFIQVANPHTLLQPGFACQVHLPLRDIPNALVVPVEAVADRNGTPVLTVVRDQKAYEIEVETGEETANLIQITAGVQPNDLVVTEGGYGLPDGFPVVVKP